MRKLKSPEWYATPRLCKKKLHTFTGMQCYECERKARLAWDVANRDKVLACARKSREKRREDTRQKYAACHKANPEKIREYVRKKYASNPTPTLEINKRRRKLLSRATPKWLTREQRKMMREMYKQAAAISKDKGEVYQVDHVIPLYSNIASGLHVPWNLQIITRSENARKSNKIHDESGVLGK